MKTIFPFPHLIKIASLFIALTVGACSQEESVEQKREETPSTTKKKQEVVPVEVIGLSQVSFQNEQIFFAQVAASSSAQLISRQGGKVNSIRVENGQSVKKGQALCDIDAKIHQTNLELAQAQFQVADTEYKRLQDYLNKDLGSQTQLDQAKVKFLQAKQAKLNALELYKEAICQAPISGKIGLKQIEANQTIGAGSPLFQIVSTQNLKLKFGIPENLISEFKRGSQITLTSTDHKVIETKISNISVLMDTQTRTFEAEAQMKNPGFPIGATVKVKAKGRKYSSQWVVPNSSIINFSDANAIMLIKDQKASRTDITILASNGTHSRITGDIKQGDMLVIANQHRLIHGSQVTIAQDGSQS